MNVGDLIDCKYGIGIVINVDRLYMGGFVIAVCAGQAQGFTSAGVRRQE